MSPRIARILSSLPHFMAVAEELHFGRAAERLGMSQPPLSRRISNLEKELGTTLFRRTRQRATLTDAGALLLRRGAALIEQAEDSIAEARRAAKGLTGRLRIGFATSALYSVLPAIVRDFSSVYGGIELSLVEMTTDMQIMQLQNRQIDIGILRSPAEDRSLSTSVLLKERLIAVLPLSHRLTKRRQLRLRDLRDEGFVMYSRSVPRLRELIIRKCEAEGFQPNIVQEAAQIPTMVSFVGAGLGVALIPESSRGAVGSHARTLKLHRDNIQVELLIATLRSSSSEAVESFVRIARKLGDDLKG